MKPIVLYEANESTFTSNGLGTLDEAITAVITEELNGIYEMQFTYPVTGKKFSEIKYSRIIKAIASPGGNYQLFRIYSISKVINGIITVNAEHISYQLAYIPVNPFTATSVVEAMAKLSANAMAACPFTFWTDKQTTANYKQTEPSNIRARLAGTSGSILDVYGGEYEFDNYTVKLHNHRGQNRNVTLRYGKNITNIEQDENIASTYTSIVGFWKSDDVVVKTGVIDSEHVSSYPFKRVKVVDFSENYDSAPTVEQLTSKATSYMSANNFGIPKVNIKVSFVALWQTEEYKNIAVLERVYLGDTVSVFYEKLGITASAKVVSTKYNVLLDRYENIELGSMRSRLSDKLAKQDAEIKEQITDAKTALEKAVERVTELIAGGTGGHVVLNTDANGKMQEILVMDTEDINTATKVWRWNLGGLGYSSTGYNGQYGTAITMNGDIVADFITTGTMTANRIRAGLLEDETGTNYWNLSTGEMRISAGTKIGAGNDTFQSIINGIQNQIDGSITSWFYNYAPSISNAPANGWNTVDERKAHVGDLFYNSSTGYCYRWQIKPNIANPGLNDFEWVRISDEDISAALQAANDAKDTADGKRRVFVATPVPPYDVGDLWAQGTNGDLMRCATAKTAGQSYSASDWVKASKYTDDTTANAVRSELTIVDGKITSEVTRATQAEGSLSSRITQTANEVRSEVTNSQKRLFANYTGEGHPDNQIFIIDEQGHSQQVGEVYYDTTNDKYYKYTAYRHDNKGALKIKFNSNTQTEATHDRITFCFENDSSLDVSIVDEDTGNEGGIVVSETTYITSNPLSGNIGGQTLYFPYTNSTKRIYFYSDGSTVKRGYKIDSIERVDEENVSYSAYTDNAGNWPSAPSGTYSKNQSYKFSTPGFDNGTNYSNNVKVYAEYAAADIPDKRTKTEYYTYGWELVDTSTSAFATVSSQIRQTAKEIQLKVSANEVVSAINLSADAIKLETAGRLIITSGNFQVDENGNVTANNARLTGANIDGTLTTGGATGSKIQIDAGAIKGFYNNAQLFTIQSTYDSTNRAAELSINSTYVDISASESVSINAKTIILGSVLANRAQVDIDVNGNAIYLQSGTLNVNGHDGYTGGIQAGEAYLSFINGILYSVNTGGDDIIIID